MEGAEGHTIDEISALAQIPSRTIRFYQSRGALMPPVIRGRVAFYGATMFFLGLQSQSDGAWPQQVFDGLSWMENAMLHDAPVAIGLLKEAVAVMPGDALAVWRERSAMMVQ